MPWLDFLLPPWAHHWLDLTAPDVQQIAIIALAAWLLCALLRRLIRQLSERHALPPQLAMIARRGSGFVIYSTALMLILDRLGVSVTILWTAFTGFVAVAAVAFFAAWSVLSNIFCTLLIFATRPFRLHDHIELLENSEKPGLKGEVIEINLLYTTLREHRDGGDSVLQIPNSLFFQRSTRRWRDHPAPPKPD